MIDLALLRNSPETVQKAIEKKDPSYDILLLATLDKNLRSLRLEVEELRRTKNELAQAAKSGITEEIRTRSLQIGKDLKVKETELEVLESKFQDLYLACPNIPLEDVPVGNKESNKVVKMVGQKPTFDFTITNHVELGIKNKWLDFETAAQISGSNFALYKGDAVKLLYALSTFMLKNNIKHGFQPVLPPVMTNAYSLQVSGNFPKFKDQVYDVKEDSLYLSPTSEVLLANIYRNQIVSLAELPIRMTAWTSCFRREAGGYGAHERGLIRIHQFEKVELVSLCEPEKSSQELEMMVACAESILQQLGLHYRISLLAAQDCSFQSAKTYDIEVWLPGQGQYYEVSSASNCTDFQARRGLIRYKATPDSKAELVHTLNASSLALPRLMVAIMETYQQPDGSIAIPEVLKKEGIF